MGADARRARRRASGTLTLTMPGSAGGWLAGVAGSLPVSRQAAGWAEPPAGARDLPGGRAGAGGGGGAGRNARGPHHNTGGGAKEEHQPPLGLIKAFLALSLPGAFFFGPSLPRPPP